MFRKPFKIKSNTQLKNSEKKKLLSDVVQNFPALSMEDAKAVFPPKEVINVAKVMCGSGAIVFVYCVNKQPLLFVCKDIMYPTIYMLWKHHDMLPHLTIYSDVLQTLQNGSDLMMPGVIQHRGILSMDSVVSVNKGDRVYVNLAENQAAIAVGLSVVSGNDMRSQHIQGKCVTVLHVYGDELWNFGTKTSIPDVKPTVHHASQQYQEHVAAVVAPSAKAVAKNVTTQEENKNSNESGTFSSLFHNKESSKPVPGSENDKTVAYHATADSANEGKINMDKLINYSFLKALLTSVKEAKLPLLVSNFYRSHMIPACPPGHTLDIKRSSYKKMSQLMDTMSNEGVIKTDSVSVGVQRIISVDYTHEKLRNFSAAIEDMDKHEINIGETKVCQKYTVTPAVLPLFSEFLLKSGNSLTPSETRKYIQQYARKKNLLDGSLVKLDDTLNSIIHPVVSEPDKQGYVMLADVIDAVCDKMGHTYKSLDAMQPNALSGKDHVGKMPIVTMRIAKRGGNKKVTIVDNLERYGINLDEFSRQCQIAVAASAAVNHVEGSKSAQLKVQGNQINYITQVLTEQYHIPVKYIRGIELGVKTKKK